MISVISVPYDVGLTLVPDEEFLFRELSFLSPSEMFMFQQTIMCDNTTYMIKYESIEQLAEDLERITLPKFPYHEDAIVFNLPKDVVLKLISCYISRYSVFNAFRYSV